MSLHRVSVCPSYVDHRHVWALDLCLGLHITELVALLDGEIEAQIGLALHCIFGRYWVARSGMVCHGATAYNTLGYDS